MWHFGPVAQKILLENLLIFCYKQSAASNSHRLKMVWVIWVIASKYIKYYSTQIRYIGL